MYEFLIYVAILSFCAGCMTGAWGMVLVAFFAVTAPVVIWALVFFISQGR